MSGNHAYPNTIDLGQTGNSTLCMCVCVCCMCLLSSIQNTKFVLVLYFILYYCSNNSVRREQKKKLHGEKSKYLRVTAISLQ